MDDKIVGEEKIVGWHEVAGALAFLALFTFFMLQWGIEGAVHNRKARLVPDLRGRSLDAALDMISPLNLALKKDGVEFNNSVAIGSVLRQTPAPGSKVREGKIIKVVISQGGETVLVPGLVGLPLRNAEMRLRQGQLLLGAVTESYSIRMAKGMVLSQSPKAEAGVGKGAQVNVTISGGPPPAGVVLMPDFVRKNLSDAMSWAAQSEAKVQVAKDPASLFPYGTVLAQEPPVDSVLRSDSVVTLTVSGRSGAAPAGTGSTRRIRYEVPRGQADSQVRIVVSDSFGEQEVFNGLRAPGSKVELEVPAPDSGRARMKVYLNGVLVEERDL